ncbi:NAD-dependent epimerase/dehydratase family protein [Paucilactobacillus nenjiangensis]|jgi:putative NADH-flavin reductase|uniref:NAD-dependent epimerase/dehydratase family protein n=1 Tax=Paucilactobacillus nenjiangensis TaxID=1296540 RepID=UPI003BAF2B20
MNIVLLGGNGYLGRNFTEKIVGMNPEIDVLVLSRSGKNSLSKPQIENIAVDLNDYDAVKNSLPDQIDYIVDFIGRPEKDATQLRAINMQPVELMKRLAEEKQVKAMGMIGGVLGAKSFVNIKAEAIQLLKTSSIPLAYVEPTLVYGNGRQDSMTKMVPLLKFFGLFAKNMKPVDVNEVVSDLAIQLFKY